MKLSIVLALFVCAALAARVNLVIPSSGAFSGCNQARELVLSNPLSNATSGSTCSLSNCFVETTTFRLTCTIGWTFAANDDNFAYAWHIHWAPFTTIAGVAYNGSRVDFVTDLGATCARGKTGTCTVTDALLPVAAQNGIIRGATETLTGPQGGILYLNVHSPVTPFPVGKTDGALAGSIAWASAVLPSLALLACLVLAAF